MSLTAITPMFAHVPPGGLAFDGVSSETVTAQFEGWKERYEYTGSYDDRDLHIGYSIYVKVEHSHKSYSGTLPPGLVSRGWTKIEKTKNGETTVEWHHQRGRIHLLQLFFEALRTSKHLNRKHGVNI